MAVIVKTYTTKKQRDAFERVARHNGRSIAEELRRAIQAHVDAHDPKSERDA